MDFSEVGTEVVEAGQVYDLEVIRPKFKDFQAAAKNVSETASGLMVSDPDTLNAAVSIGGNAKRIAKAVDLQRKQIIAEPSEFISGVNGICRVITDSLSEAEATLKQRIGQYKSRVEMERLERERKAREEAEALQRKLDAEVAEANRKAAEEARKRAEEEQRIKREKEDAEARERGAKKKELEALAKKQEEERLAAIRKAEEEAKKNEVVAPQVVAPVVQEAPKVTRTESGSAAFSKKPWIFEVTDEAKVPREFLSVDEKKIRDAVRMGVREIPGVNIHQDNQINFRA